MQKCGGPVMHIGLGRTDASVPAPPHRPPGGYEGAALLKTMFARMGLGARELVVRAARLKERLAAAARAG